LWIGTESGLNRYLNTNFELFNETTPGGQLAGHAVSTVFLDQRGWVWIGDRFMGLSCYKPGSNSWRRFYNQSGPNTRFEGKEIIDLIEDGNGDIWIAAFPDYLIHYSVSADSFTHHKLHIEKAYYGIQSLHRLNEHELLINTGSQGVVRFDIRDGKFHKDLAFYRAFGIEYVSFNDKICTDKKGNTLLIKEGGIFLQRAGAKKAYQVGSYEGSERPACNYTIDGDFLLSIFPYILRFDSNYCLVESKKMLTRYNDRILNCVVKSICQDRQGILWLGTNEGVLKIDPAKQVFKSFMNIPNLAPLYQGEEDIRCLLVDDQGNVWAGPRKGASILCMSARVDAKRPMKYDILSKKSDKHTVNCMIQLRDGRILAAGYSGFFVKSKGKKFTPFFPTENENPALANAWSILQLADANLLIGTKDLGLFYFDIMSGLLTPIELLNTDGSQFSENFATWNIFQDHDLNVWLATSKGLYKALRQSSTSYQLISYLNLKDCSVWSVAQAKNGILWFGTVEYGLIGLDANGNKVSSIGLTDGLPSMTIRGIVEDTEGQLWVSTSAAISRIRFENGKPTIRNFDVLDGLPVEGFSSKSACQGPMNNLFFGSKKGIVFFDPKAVSPVKKRGYLLLRNMHVSNSSVTIQNFQGDILELSAGNNSFALEPALTDYSNPEKNKFYYLLEGVDEIWHHSSGEHPSIHYSRILPGNYSLHIRAENPDGTPAINEWHIPIVVQTYFWLRTWFKTSIIGFLIVLVIYAIYLTLNRLRLRRQLLKSEIASLRLQMNPHFIFNSLNSIQDLIYHDEKRLASSYLTRIARLIRSILENSSKTSVSLEDEIGFLRLYLELEALRFPTHFSYAIEVDPSIDIEEYTIPPMLLQPLIENALKHGMGGEERNLELKIIFEDKGHYLLCRIVDNGVGFPYDESKRLTGHHSMGLLVVRERLKFLNRLEGKKYAIEVDSSKRNRAASGTEIKLQL